MTFKVLAIVIVGMVDLASPSRLAKRAAQTSDTATPQQSTNDQNCPLSCPEGWVVASDEWGGATQDCYKLPSNPAELDTFSNQKARCNALDPSATIMVVNTLAEYAIISAIVSEYSPNLFPNLTNQFVWLGGYGKNGHWELLDGTTATKNVLFMGSPVSTSDAKDGLCLAADATTLGMWNGRSCDEKVGAAICEMPRQPICGNFSNPRTPSIYPNLLSPCTVRSLFPNLLNTPYIGAMLAEVDDDMTYHDQNNSPSWVNNSLCSSQNQAPQPQCTMVCPPNFHTLSSSVNEDCYYVSNGTTGSFWDMQATCQSYHPSAYILCIKDFLEQSLVTQLAKATVRLFPQLSNVKNLWLGGYGVDSSKYPADGSKSWKFLDTTDGGYILAVVNVQEPAINGSCVMADMVNLGNWHGAPCSSNDATIICEAPKLVDCSGAASSVNAQLTVPALTPKDVQKLFPNMPKFPGLPEYLGIDKTEEVFDPWEALSSNQKYGYAVSNVVCAKDDGSTVAGSPGQPANKFLVGWYAGNTRYVVPGKWIQIQCKSGTVDAFKIHASTYLTVWSYCFNQGFHVAMPFNSNFDGWRPFLADGYLGDYYQRTIDPKTKTTTYKKILMSRLEDC